MANRFVLKQFAGSATNNGAFGAAQATGAGVQPVANIEDVQFLAAFEQGWNSATLTADKLPPLEEMQGLEAILCKAIKELYSEGIPVWIAGETYYQNSRAVYNGKIYRNTTGSYTANNPATDTTNWELDKPDFAGIADKLGSSTVGSPSQGIYLVDGVPTPVTAVTGANVDLSNLSANGLTKIFKTGMIIPWGGTSSNKPDGWLVCDGSAVSRETYADLFAIIGTAYGTGDGTTTFNLPNFTGKWAGGNGNGYLSAGLPNITGTTSSVSNYSNYNGSASGAFYNSTGMANVPFSMNNVAVLQFNASNSNAIYGAASTVQPPTCKSYWLIKY